MTDMNQPPVTISTPRSVIRACITGGTLNWLMATTMPATNAANITDQPLRFFFTWDCTQKEPSRKLRLAMDRQDLETIALAVGLPL
jgi:hypothetical protein